ncbi:hypothetical protein [Anaerosalibacter sp. Marseille-P3206]|nr:hypothetical protein [Anaerosalibacter sp. Marseille-P3206]
MISFVIVADIAEENNLKKDLKKLLTKKFKYAILIRQLKEP